MMILDSNLINFADKDAATTSSTTSCTPLSFPRQLFRMLEEASMHGFDHIVSWQPGDISFKVHKPKQFENVVLQVYFNQTKYKSFQRQVNMYGFCRLHIGPNKGGYASKLFLRHQPDLCDRMTRGKCNDAGLASSSELTKVFEQDLAGQSAPKQPSQPFTSIDMEPIKIKDMVPAIDMSMMFNCSNVSVGSSDHPGFDPIPFTGSSSTNPPIDVFTSHNFVEDTSSRSHSRSSSISSMEDSLEDIFAGTIFDQSPSPDESAAPRNTVSNETATPSNDAITSSVSASLAADSQTSSFPWKLHIMLEDSEKKNFQHIISWVKNGSAFKVHKRKEFVKTIMPNYFDQTQYESFRRQLNLYGFTRIARGGDRGVVSHPQFVKGCRFLCEMIKRNQMK